MVSIYKKTYIWKYFVLLILRKKIQFYRKIYTDETQIYLVAKLNLKRLLKLAVPNTKNSTADGKRNILTLGSLCLPC